MALRLNQLLPSPLHVPRTAPPPLRPLVSRLLGSLGNNGARPIRKAFFALSENGKRNEALTRTRENYAPGYVDFRASVGLRKISDVWGNIEGAGGCKARCGSENLAVHISHRV